MTEVDDGGVAIRSGFSALVGVALDRPEYGPELRAWPAARLEE
jgi:hypothetical protein